MPKWWVHNKWARKFGITLADDSLNAINDLIDQVTKKYFPNGLLVEYLSHDWGRHRKWEKIIQEDLIEERYGYEGVLAAQLHHLLDIIDEFTNPQRRQQMDAFKEAVKEAKGSLGIVRRFDGKPTRNPAEKVIPKVARRIQGLLGKCCICGRSLSGEPHRYLGRINGKNVCAHLKCLQNEGKRIPSAIQLKLENLAEIQVLNLTQIKKEIMQKAIEIGICAEIIEFVMRHFSAILNDIEDSRSL